MCPFCAEYPVSACFRCVIYMFSFNGDDEREARDDSTVPPSKCAECGGDPHHTPECSYVKHVGKSYRAAMKRLQEDAVKR